MKTPAVVVTEWFERVWNQNDASHIDSGLAECCKVSGLGEDIITTREEFHVFHATMNESFADIHVEIDYIMDQGEEIIGIATVTGTHKQSGQAVNFQSAFRGIVRDDQIVEAVNLIDYLPVLIQIGALPADAAPRALGGEVLVTP